MKKESEYSESEGWIGLLTKEFGEEHSEEIRDLYKRELELLTKVAKINHSFIPNFAYKETRNILKAEYKPGYLEKQIEKIEKRIHEDKKQKKGLIANLFYRFRNQ